MMKSGKIALHHWYERIELEVALLVADRAIVHRERIVARAIEPIAQIINVLLIGLARFLRRLLVTAETAEPAAASATRQAGPINDHGRRTPDVHFSRASSRQD